MTARIEEVARVLAELVDEKVEAKLAALGIAAVEFSSRGPLPVGVTARAFREAANRMLRAGHAGVRVEGAGRRARVLFVTREAWRVWRTVMRTPDCAVVERSDEELAAMALGRAGLRLVGGRAR